MPGPYSRRHLLRIGSGSAVAVALAGCTGGRSNRSCELHHEVSTSNDTADYSGETIPYENLSPEGKEVFETAFESDAYNFTYDGDNKPPDFSYSDEVTTYVIEYEGEQYAFRTHTGEGCVIE